MTLPLLLFTSLLLIAYVLGSVPSAVIVCRLMGLPDPRQHGSKNPGTTNVLRIGGKRAAVATLIGDMLKGFLPVIIAHVIGLGTMFAAWVLLAAFIGHVLPLFTRFQGGKGVATLLGGLLALSWLIGIATVLTWLIIAALTRYSSLSAMIAAIMAPLYAFLLAPAFTWLPLTILAIVLLWRHKHNMQRLINGTESKIGNKANSE